MTHGFQQQDRSVNFSFPKSAPSPQHGQQPDRRTCLPTKPARTFEPRPGH